MEPSSLTSILEGRATDQPAALLDHALIGKSIFRLVTLKKARQVPTHQKSQTGLRGFAKKMLDESSLTEPLFPDATQSHRLLTPLSIVCNRQRS